MGYASPKNSNRLAAGLCDVMKVDSQYYVSIEDGEFTEWHFTKHGNAYYIWTGDESAPQYINIPATDSKDETLRVSGEPQDLYLEKVHHLAVKQDGTQAEQEQPARLLRHSRRQKLFNIIKCRTNRRSILSMISHQKLAFVHLEKGTFIDLA